MSAHAAILDRVARYYGGKLCGNGPTAAGADWKSAEQQALRFDQLLKIIDCQGRFAINDYGCGYGALIEHLRRTPHGCDYRGFDICPDMIDQARRLHTDAPDCKFFSEAQLIEPGDYSVASGIFNVKGNESDQCWSEYMRDTIARIAAISRRGFAFNVLSRYVDFRREDLYYADPCSLMDHCITRYSRRVAILHDYGLYEFTLLVRL